MVFLQDSCSIITGFVHEESSTAPHARFYPWFKHAVVFATNFRRNVPRCIRISASIGNLHSGVSGACYGCLRAAVEGGV